MNPSSSKKTVNLWQYPQTDSVVSLHNLPASKRHVRIHNFVAAEVRLTEASTDSLFWNSRRKSDFKPYRISDNKLNLQRKSNPVKTPTTLREAMDVVKSRRRSHDFTHKTSKARLKLFLDDDNSCDLDDQITFLKENVIDRLVGIS